MKLAKPRFDIGLATNNLGPMLQFWQAGVGASFDHRLDIRPGLQQHRHDVAGSVLKINHRLDTLPRSPPSGYAELLIARHDIFEPQALVDPDGNQVSLVCFGYRQVEQVGVRLRVRDLDAQRSFYSQALGLPEFHDDHGAGFRVGESVILIEQDNQAPLEAPFEGEGWRYLTLQVFAVDSDHRHALSEGGREALAPTTLGTTARISMVKDPAGNWIELSQRASIPDP